MEQRRFWYRLVEFGAQERHMLSQMENTVAVLVRLERATDAEDAWAVLRGLRRWLTRSELNSARNVLFKWVNDYWHRERFGESVWSEIEDLRSMEEHMQPRGTSFVETAREEVRRVGWAEGRQTGERHVLRRQLERKVGPLTEDIQARLVAATPEELLLWAERALEAQSLQEVFR